MGATFRFRKTGSKTSAKLVDITFQRENNKLAAAALG